MSDATVLELEHWIYGASHEKGYGTKAESRGLNGPLYMRYLENHLTPVRVEKTAGGGTLIDARMIHPAPANREVLLSILGRGVADEYNRPTIANHTVVIPYDALRTGQLRFADVEAATVEFDHKFPKALGKVDPIPVKLRAPGESQEPRGSGIRRLITKAAVDTLASRFLADHQGRTLILCRGSSNQYRNELLYHLVELLHAGEEIALFPAISDAPTLSAMNHFRLAISSRGVRADGSWTLLDASIDQPTLPPIKGKSLVYNRIAEAFAST
ncbi:MAG TPA: hypothetical protein VEK13_00420 [Thermoplasmata archaeon]|jgi:hypothetical protein|nr:hypothetical protein [Thermoplasmata archaeon]